jgi:F-type H+-transporting ATPase subunit epsilon
LQRVFLNLIIQMFIEIIAPQQTIYSGDVKLVQVPGSQGSFTALKNHRPIISTLEEGVVRIVTIEGDEKFFPIKLGFVDIKDNKISILATV